MEALSLALSELRRWSRVVGKYATEPSLGICSRLPLPICWQQTAVHTVRVP